MNRLNNPMGVDSYELEEPSDEERASSSEDELDVLLNGTAQQKRRLIREYLTGESESSSGDEFEKEMDAELSSTLKTLEGSWGPLATGPPCDAAGGSSERPPLPDAPMYDDVYFDSDSEDEDTPSSSTGKRRRQRRIPTNDELFYDPDEDDRNQARVDSRRRAYSRRAGPLKSGPGLPGLPSSDAVLNCPACMTTLCLDCQRHERYRTQYRAMFVLNCTVKRDQVLRYKTPQQRKTARPRRKRKSKEQKEAPEGAAQEQAPAGALEEVVGPRGMAGEEVYHPVQCTECSTEVAVLDQEDVFHFFNILASHC